MKNNRNVWHSNKKAFQSNANRPLADSPRFIVNKFEHVQGWSLHDEVKAEQVVREGRGGGGVWVPEQRGEVPRCGRR